MNEKEVADIIRMSRLTGTDPVKIIAELSNNSVEVESSQMVSGLPMVSSKSAKTKTAKKPSKMAVKDSLPKKATRLTDLTQAQRKIVFKQIYTYLNTITRPVSSRDIHDALNAYIGISLNPRAIGAALSQASGPTIFERTYGEVLNVSSNPNKGALYILKSKSTGETFSPKTPSPSKVVHARRGTGTRRKPVVPGIKLRNIPKGEVDVMMKLLLEESSRRGESMEFEDIKTFLESLCGKQLHGASLSMTIRQPLGPFSKATNHKFVMKGTKYVTKKLDGDEISSSL